MMKPVLLLLLCAFVLALPTALAQPDDPNACRVTTATANASVLMRVGPERTFPRTLSLFPDQFVQVTGQRASAEDGKLWWRTFNGDWIAAEGTRAEGDCENVPFVEEAPQEYCRRRVEMVERPVVGERVQRLYGERVVVHYALQGEHRTTEAYAQATLEITENILDGLVNTLGWTMIPPDCGEGGDPRFDVYILSLKDQNRAGYARADYLVGNNPFTEATETTSRYSHVVVDSTLPPETLRITLTQELHHSVLFSYTFDPRVNILSEAVVAWTEAYFYPDFETISRFNESVLATPDLCMGYNVPNETTHRNRTKGEWLLIQSIVKDYGINVLADFMWGYRTNFPALASVVGLDGRTLPADIARQLARPTLVHYATVPMRLIADDPQTIMRRYHIRNLLNDSMLPDRLLTPTAIEGIFASTNLTITPKTGVQELGADFVNVTGVGTFRFSINDRLPLQLFFIGLDRYSGRVTTGALGAGGVVNITPYTDAYIMVFNPQIHADPARCTHTNWQLFIESARGDEEARLQDQTALYDLKNFRSPLQRYGVEAFSVRVRTEGEVVRHRVSLQAGEYVEAIVTPENPEDVRVQVSVVNESGSLLIRGSNNRTRFIPIADGTYIVEVRVTGLDTFSANLNVVVGVNERANSDMFPYER